MTVYNGTNFPNVLKNLVSGLKTARAYRFTIQAINFNGVSEASNIATFTICAVPSSFSPPKMTGYLRTSMTLKWQSPGSSGGCFITSYHIYRDDGNLGAFTLIDDSTVANLPAKREHTMTFTSAQTGLTFKYYMTAVSSVGFA